MRIIKHEHACLEIEKGGDRLVIDPGGFTTPLIGLHDVVGIVITHEHQDHWTPEQLERLREFNPEAPILSTQAVADAAEGFGVRVVHAGKTAQLGPFELSFHGGTHAEIHRSIPLVDNVAVLVDGLLLHPGDSYTVPEGIEIDTLAVPASAPWLKIGEVMDYVDAVKPKRSFPIHEMVNSQIGNQMANGRIGHVTEQGGGEFFPLAAGETLDI